MKNKNTAILISIATAQSQTPRYLSGCLRIVIIETKLITMLKMGMKDVMLRLITLQSSIICFGIFSKNIDMTVNIDAKIGINENMNAHIDIR